MNKNLSLLCDVKCIYIMDQGNVDLKLMFTIVIMDIKIMDCN